MNRCPLRAMRDTRCRRRKRASNFSEHQMCNEKCCSQHSNIDSPSMRPHRPSTINNSFTNLLLGRNRNCERRGFVCTKVMSSTFTIRRPLAPIQSSMHIAHGAKPPTDRSNAFAHSLEIVRTEIEQCESRARSKFSICSKSIDAIYVVTYYTFSNATEWRCRTTHSYMLSVSMEWRCSEKINDVRVWWPLVTGQRPMPKHTRYHQKIFETNKWIIISK